jgi:hypothetical protein
LNYTITTEGTYRFKNKKEEPKWMGGRLKED